MEEFSHELEAESLSVADVEKILLDIHDCEQEIAHAAEIRDQSVDFYRQRIDRAKKNFDDETESARDHIASLSFTLEKYFRNNPPPKGRKSLNFAGGRFGYNKASTKFFKDGDELNADNPALLEFVKQAHPEFVKVKEYVDWAAFKAAIDFDAETVFFRETGEILDGVRARKKFVVKVTS